MTDRERLDKLENEVAELREAIAYLVLAVGDGTQLTKNMVAAFTHPAAEQKERYTDLTLADIDRQSENLQKATDVIWGKES